MKSRSVCALAATLYVAVACSGAAFTASPDGASGSGGSSAGMLGAGGKNGSAGSVARAGSNGMTNGAGQSMVEPTGGVPPDIGAGGVVMSSAGVPGDGGAPPIVPVCTGIDQCPAVTSKCREATCDAGMCGEKNLPNGPFTFQVAGDCKELLCQDGKEQILPDANDNNDNNECTTDSCGAQGAVHTGRLGQVCGNGSGLCSHENKCETCNRNLCPQATECKLPLCINGTCQLSPRPTGTLCASQTNQCDANGTCVDCTDNGGCDEASVCNNAHMCVPAP